MRTVFGSGCWPGQAAGTVIWVDAWDGEWLAGAPPVPDRTREVLRLRAEIGRAAQDLEQWSEAQPVVAGRLVLQTCREAMQEKAWINRACSLVDRVAMPAAAAVVEAGRYIGTIMGNRGDLSDRAQALRSVSTWLAQRLEATSHTLAPDAIVAATNLGPLQLMDLAHPAILGGPEPTVMGRVPLVWGVPGLGPDWTGRHITLDGSRIVWGSASGAQRLGE